MSRTEEPVIYKTEGKVAHIILNRPDHLNAFTFETPFLIRDFVEKANADPSLHVRIRFTLLLPVKYRHFLRVIDYISRLRRDLKKKIN